MSAHEDGGPAFPATSWTKDGDFIGDNQGMTLRDYFAAQFAPVMIRMIADGLHQSVKRPADEAAMSAYALADAMLKARQS